MYKRYNQIERIITVRLELEGEQEIAHIDWVDTLGMSGCTHGRTKRPRIGELLQRAEKEGVKVMR